MLFIRDTLNILRIQPMKKVIRHVKSIRPYSSSAVLTLLNQVKQENSSIADAGLWKSERVISTKQGKFKMMSNLPIGMIH